MNSLKKNKYSLIFEIYIEDISIKNINNIIYLMLKKFKNELYINNIIYNKVNIYYSSRRISIIANNLTKSKNNITKFIIGPSIKNSFNNNIYTKIFINWVNKYKININNLKYLIRDNGIWFIYYLNTNKKLFNIKKILYKSLYKSLIELKNNSLNITFDKNYKFIKPIIYITILINNNFVSGNIFGIKLSNFFYGNINKLYEKIYIKNNKEYISKLKKIGKVILNNNIRKKNILKNINSILLKFNLNTMDKYIYSNIDNYVFINEYPSVIYSEFNIYFIEKIPEIIILYIINNCKFIPTYYKNKLNNKFIFISNIISKDYENIIYWNTYIINNLLNEIYYFFNKDITENTLTNLKHKLKLIIFRKNLGNIYNKIYRVKKIILYILKLIKINFLINLNNIIDLYKIDLSTYLCLFFPKLYGIVGSIYYCIKNKNYFNNFIFDIIKKQYNIEIYNNYNLNNLTYILILSDKLDTLVGNFISLYYKFNINSNNDYLYIKRYTIYIIKILINLEYNIKISYLIKKNILLFNKSKSLYYFIIKIKKFFINRLINYYINYFPINIINSVIFYENDNIFDIDLRIKSIYEFINKNENSIKNIINTNKRINNLIDNKLNKLNKLNKFNLFNLFSKNKHIIEIREIEYYLNNNIDKKKYILYFENLNILCNKINIYINNTIIFDNRYFVRKYRLFTLYYFKKIFCKLINFDLLNVKK